MCEYFFFPKFFSKSVKSECKIKVWFHFHQNKAYAKQLFAYGLCEFFEDPCLVYFFSNCYELSQLVFFFPRYIWSNMSKTSASVSSGVSNTEKLMKARGRRPSAFIVSRCLEPLMKHEARVFDMTSQSRQKIQCNKACENNVFPAGMVNSSCKSLLVFWKPFVAC